MKVEEKVRITETKEYVIMKMVIKMKWVEKGRRFMQDRYGTDELYTFLLYIYVALLCFDLLFHNWILSIVVIVEFTIMFYRVFSKNKKRRRKENELYLKIKEKLVAPFLSLQRRWKDKDTLIYKKCSRCKTTLRIPLPSERGIKHVTCPKCKKRLTVLCLRKVKVEIFNKDGKRKK